MEFEEKSVWPQHSKRGYSREICEREILQSIIILDVDSDSRYGSYAIVIEAAPGGAAWTYYSMES